MAFIFIIQAGMLCMIYDTQGNGWSRWMMRNKTRTFLFRSYVVLSVPFMLFCLLASDHFNHITVIFAVCHAIVTGFVWWLHGHIRKKVIEDFGKR